MLKVKYLCYRSEGSCTAARERLTQDKHLLTPQSLMLSLSSPLVLASIVLQDGVLNDHMPKMPAMAFSAHDVSCVNGLSSTHTSSKSDIELPGQWLAVANFSCSGASARVATDKLADQSSNAVATVFGRRIIH